MSYIVTAGAVVAKFPGGEGYFYSGATLPETVSREECKRLASIGLVEFVDDEDDIDDVGTGRAEGDDTPDASWKIAELQAYAAEHQIDLGAATKKADILAKLQA